MHLQGTSTLLGSYGGMLLCSLHLIAYRKRRGALHIGGKRILRSWRKPTASLECPIDSPRVDDAISADSPPPRASRFPAGRSGSARAEDRKSTRLNSSHVSESRMPS